MSAGQFLLIFQLDKLVALSEVGVLAQSMDVELGSLLAALALSFKDSFFNRNFDDLVEGGLFDVLSVLVDGGDGSVCLSGSSVDCSEFDVLSAFLAFSVQN